MSSLALLAMKAVGLNPVCEFKFHPARKWRIDYAFPDVKLAVEIEGAVWQQGRHTRGSGFVKDMEKYNALTVLGWRLLRFTPQNIDVHLIRSVYNNLVVGTK